MPIGSLYRLALITVTSRIIPIQGAMLGSSSDPSISFSFVAVVTSNYAFSQFFLASSLSPGPDLMRDLRLGINMIDF